MEKFYKFAKTITYVFGVLTIAFQILRYGPMGLWFTNFYEIGGFGFVMKVLVCSCIISIGMVILVSLYIGLISRAENGSKVRKLSIIAIIGISILLIKDIILWINPLILFISNDYNFLTPDLSTYYYYCYCLGYIIFSIAILLFALMFYRKSLAYIGGLSFVVFSTLYILYNNLPLVFPEIEITPSYFYLSNLKLFSIPAMLMILRDLGLCVHLFGLSNNK